MNVSSSPFSSFGAFLFLGFLVLTLTLDDALAKDDAKAATDGVKVTPGLDDWSIISDIIGSRRTILLFASLSTHLLIIVSASGQTNLTFDAVVFEQESTSLTGTSLTLTSGQLLKDKWPKLILSAGSLAVLSDTNGHYLAIANSGQLYLFNLATKARVPFKAITDQSSQAYFDNAIVLSSSEAMSVYSLKHESNIGMMSGTFGGNTWTSFTTAQSSLSYYYLCNSGQTQFNWIIPAIQCPKPLTWRITSGGIIDSSAYLIDASTSSIIKFDKSALTASTKTNTTFTILPFATFWAKPPTLPPTTTRKPTTHLFITVHAHHHLALIIIIVVVVSSLLIAALVYYLLRKRASNARNDQEQALAANEEMPKGGGSQSGVANLKSSMRNGQGRASEGATASKVTNTSTENGQQDGTLHEPTQLIAPIEEQVPVLSNQKIIKLSRRRGSSKKILSKQPVSSGKVPPTHRSSLGRQSSAQRRAPSGKVPSGRRSSLKRKGSSKGRTASGKTTPPSHRFSSGKAASSHHASGKRTASGKHRASSGKAATPRRTASGKAASPHRASLKRKASGQHWASSGKAPTPKRVASGKTTPPKRASLKRKASSKRRVSSGKAATPKRVASGKTTPPRRASLKRKASGKRRVSLGKAATPKRASSKRKGSIKRRASGKASLRRSKR